MPTDILHSYQVLFGHSDTQPTSCSRVQTIYGYRGPSEAVVRQTTEEEDFRPDCTCGLPLKRVVNVTKVGKN